MRTKRLKDRDIESFNYEITKFIQNVAIYEEDFINEAPEVWIGILSAISNLSKAMVFLDNVRKNEVKEDLDFYNKMRMLNGLPETDHLPANMTKNNDIDLGKYRAPWQISNISSDIARDNPSHTCQKQSQEKV